MTATSNPLFQLCFRGSSDWQSSCTAPIRDRFGQQDPTATQSNYKIVVRATDKKGQVQTAEVRPPFPDGNTGYHIINI